MMAISPGTNSRMILLQTFDANDFATWRYRFANMQYLVYVTAGPQFNNNLVLWQVREHQMNVIRYE